MFANRDGTPVAINYGSAAGELAVCVRAVGLVDRSDLVKLAIDGPPAQLRDVMMRLTGGALSPGGARLTGGAWWCCSSPDRVIALCEAPVGRRLHEQLRSMHHVGLSAIDRSSELAAIALLGPATARLLRTLGAYGGSGDPRDVPPFHAGSVGGVEVQWLLESERHALALVRRHLGGQLWRTIERSGRHLGLSCVGLEAAGRYALLERNGRKP